MTMGRLPLFVIRLQPEAGLLTRADEFDVSEQAMRYRLVNLGLIDPA